MKLSQLEQIIEIANTGTISQAAVNLFISQPNLSLSIKQAEEELGTKLFYRKSSGMTLTPSGIEFVERAKEILQQIDALSEACRSDNTFFPLKLSIVSISHRIVDIEIAKLLQKYGQNFVRANLFNAAGVKLLEHVADGRAELGFCTVYDFTKQVMLRHMSLRNLEYHVISELQPGIYVGVNNRRFSKQDKEVDFEKIRYTPVVRLARREFNTRTIQDHLLETNNILLSPKSEIIVSNFGMLRNMINLMDCYAIAAYIDVPYGQEGFYPDVRFIPFPPGTLKAEFGYIQQENTTRSPLANELLKNIKRRFV